MTIATGRQKFLDRVVSGIGKKKREKKTRSKELNT
jgi:hypothetical protein